MSDLIFNINFSESKNKNYIVIETFIGKIPKLKSRKYSGLLRIVNINALSAADNFSDVQLERALKFFNNNLNIQTGKNQYLISASNLAELKFLTELAVCFIKNIKKARCVRLKKLFMTTPLIKIILN